MRLDLGRTFNDAAHGGDLFRRNNRRDPAPSHNVDDPGSAQNLDRPVSSVLNKDIARKQRELELFGTVPPTMSCTVQREENIVPLIRKRLRDSLFVLVPRIQSMPMVRGLDGPNFAI